MNRNKRQFSIETPIGTINVWAKHDTDCPENYPGVYIDVDLCDKAGEHTHNILFCAEYSASENMIRASVYHPEQSIPVYKTELKK